jgi:leader peptidase (prepilin peptidase) / N-methyltransferase
MAEHARYRACVLGVTVGVSVVFGLVIGSFLNVVIHRVPAGLSIVRPPSRCPSCEQPIAPRDNVPVLSWLLLRARCRHCHAPISARYPAVEGATAVLFGLIAWRIGASWELPAFLVLTAGLVALSVIDLDTFRLPRQIIYVTGAAGTALLVVAAFADDDWTSLRDALIGAAIAFGVLLVIHLISPRGMGFGDVRLAGLIGLYLGWMEPREIAVGLFFAFLLASLIGVGLIALGLRSRKDRIPFGPFLAAGALLAVLVGPWVLDVYPAL